MVAVTLVFTCRISQGAFPSHDLLKKPISIGEIIYVIKNIREEQ